MWEQTASHRRRHKNNVNQCGQRPWEVSRSAPAQEYLHHTRALQPQANSLILERLEYASRTNDVSRYPHQFIARV